MRCSIVDACDASSGRTGTARAWDGLGAGQLLLARRRSEFTEYLNEILQIV